MIDDWWKIKREYKKCQQSLKLQKLAFEENLEQLLSTLVQDDDELKLLTAKPGGDLWKGSKLEDGLKARLPRSYEVYLEIINDILDVVETLKKEIGADVPAFRSKLECAEVSTALFFTTELLQSFYTHSSLPIIITPRLTSFLLSDLTFSVNIRAI